MLVGETAVATGEVGAVPRDTQGCGKGRKGLSSLGGGEEGQGAPPEEEGKEPQVGELHGTGQEARNCP